MEYEKSYHDYQALREHQDLLRRRVNDKVEITSNKVEKEFELLMKRKQEIEMNKGDLIKDMEELDIKRKVIFSLSKCYYFV